MEEGVEEEVECQCLSSHPRTYASHCLTGQDRKQEMQDKMSSSQNSHQWHNLCLYGPLNSPLNLLSVKFH